MTTETVGDVFEKQGPCALMAAVVTLAEARGRIPVGFWDVDLEPGWRLVVNGTPETRSDVLPWHAMVQHNGLPLALFNTVEGTQVGGPDAYGRTAEDRCLEALQRAVASSRRPQGRDKA